MQKFCLLIPVHAAYKLHLLSSRQAGNIRNLFQYLPLVGRVILQKLEKQHSKSMSGSPDRLAYGSRGLSLPVSKIYMYSPCIHHTLHTRLHL